MRMPERINIAGNAIVSLRKIYTAYMYVYLFAYIFLYNMVDQLLTRLKTSFAIIAVIATEILSWFLDSHMYRDIKFL